MEKIPKIIHYCWFGRGKMPKLALKCIASWLKYLPDYEIKLWNEDNFDININTYVKEAYNAKKYAFVADYVRLYALYQEGGIYMDTDEEIIKPLDEFLHHEAFLGFQICNEISAGLIGAKPKNNWIKAILEVYENKRFVKNDGTFDMLPNVSIITQISKGMGLKEENKFQMFGDGVAIYPFEYFCAKNYVTGELCVTNNTYGIQHYAGSWLPLSLKLKKRIRRIIGEKTYILIKNIVKGLRIRH